MDISKSYLKVQYDLRPAKQAERRMLLDAFQKLARGGFPIHSYQYSGMGSIHFTDYILFHKYLGLKHMLSAEMSKDIEKRISFNKPFDFVEVRVCGIGECIPTLSRDRKHIVWLDYDCLITEECLEDVVTAVAHLPPQSILLVTFDAEPPGSDSDNPAEWKKYFANEASDYFDDKEVVTRETIATVNRKIVRAAMEKGILDRDDLAIVPLFNFEYADGHRMITLGAMICSRDDQNMINASGITEAEYYRSDLVDSPFYIQVPILTRRERLYLESKMPVQDAWLPEDFELDPADVERYKTIYRYLPSYAELLM